MSDQDVSDVMTALGKVLSAYEMRREYRTAPASAGTGVHSTARSQDSGAGENGNRNVPWVRLRPADRQDCKLLFDWVNLPEVRAASFSSDPITFSTHETWYERKLADSGCRIFIALDDNGKEAGVIRFEREDDEAIVSITVAPTHRGRGYASAMITAACRHAGLPGIRRFVAEIKDGHEISERAFARAQFRVFQHFKKQGAAAIRMELPVTKA
jgi:RimJ/RimL family protein N-acetyltransferase